MAAGQKFVCSACSHSLVAWDEGNPSYRDERGRKHYAYHPDPDRMRCTGVESPMICLACGTEAVHDSAAPITHCPQCHSEQLIDVWALDGWPSESENSPRLRRPKRDGAGASS